MTPSGGAGCTRPGLFKRPASSIPRPGARPVRHSCAASLARIAGELPPVGAGAPALRESFAPPSNLERPGLAGATSASTDATVFPHRTRWTPCPPGAGNQPLDNMWILYFAFAIELHDLDPRHFDAPTAALSVGVAAKQWSQHQAAPLIGSSLEPAMCRSRALHANEICVRFHAITAGQAVGSCCSGFACRQREPTVDGFPRTSARATPLRAVPRLLSPGWLGCRPLRVLWSLQVSAEGPVRHGTQLWIGSGWPGNFKILHAPMTIVRARAIEYGHRVRSLRCLDTLGRRLNERSASRPSAAKAASEP